MSGYEYVDTTPEAWVCDEDPMLLIGRALAIAISGYSEGHSCASWLIGVEFSLWEYLHNADSDMLSTAERRVFAGLRDALGGGWVVWMDDASYDLLDPSSHTPGYGGVVLLTAEQWAEARAKGPSW